MQDLSFHFRNPLFRLNGLQFGVQLFTFENVYGLDEAACRVTEEEGRLSVTAAGLTTDGGQTPAPGSLALLAEKRGDRTRFSIRATADKRIRSVKLLLKGFVDGTIVSQRAPAEQAIPDDGLQLRYPDGWRGLPTPLVVLRAADGQHYFFRSLDNRVREKHFVFLRDGETLTVELLFEELATEGSSSIVVPTWEVGPCASVAAIMAEQEEHIAAAYNLVRWEDRPDVPAWARQISLVAAIHGRHWSGYVFNDYAKMLATIRWLAERIDPQQILAYLPGWEGRYYWQYGEYRPDPRMGGEDGFRELLRGARELGAHVMPMFGINVVNWATENFEQWGVPSLTSRAGGVPSGPGGVDWDSSRSYDPAWVAVLNPGAPGWQNRLVEQVTRLVDKYEFEGVFLDISAVWLNDPRYHTYAGVGQMVRRIKAGRPDLLLSGEGWYDAHGGDIPLLQAASAPDEMRWHDLPYAPLFDNYTRSFAHLCLGDPGRGSTGVHEYGTYPLRRAPLRKGVIPTVTIVEDTLEGAPDAVMEIIEDGKEYARRYLNRA